MKAKLYRNRLKNLLVVKLELDTANYGSAAKLVLKIRSVSDGNKEDLKIRPGSEASWPSLR